MRTPIEQFSEDPAAVVRREWEVPGVTFSRIKVCEGPRSCPKRHADSICA